MLFITVGVDQKANLKIAPNATCESIPYPSIAKVTKNVQKTGENSSRSVSSSMKSTAATKNEKSKENIRNYFSVVKKSDKVPPAAKPEFPNFNEVQLIQNARPPLKNLANKSMEREQLQDPNININAKATQLSSSTANESGSKNNWQSLFKIPNSRSTDNSDNVSISTLPQKSAQITSNISLYDFNSQESLLSIKTNKKSQSSMDNSRFNYNPPLHTPLARKMENVPNEKSCIGFASAKNVFNFATPKLKSPIKTSNTSALNTIEVGSDVHTSCEPPVLQNSVNADKLACETTIRNHRKATEFRPIHSNVDSPAKQIKTPLKKFNIQIDFIDDDFTTDLSKFKANNSTSTLLNNTRSSKHAFENTDDYKISLKASLNKILGIDIPNIPMPKQDLNVEVSNSVSKCGSVKNADKGFWDDDKDDSDDCYLVGSRDIFERLDTSPINENGSSMETEQDSISNITRPIINTNQYEYDSSSFHLPHSEIQLPRCSNEKSLLRQQSVKHQDMSRQRDSSNIANRINTNSTNVSNQSISHQPPTNLQRNISFFSETTPVFKRKKSKIDLNSLVKRGQDVHHRDLIDFDTMSVSSRTTTASTSNRQQIRRPISSNTFGNFKRDKEHEEKIKREKYLEWCKTRISNPKEPNYNEKQYKLDTIRHSVLKLPVDKQPVEQVQPEEEEVQDNQILDFDNYDFSKLYEF